MARPAPGVFLPGCAAWASGFLVGLVPTIGSGFGGLELRRFQPAALFAYGVSLVVFAGLSRLGVGGRCSVEP